MNNLRSLKQLFAPEPASEDQDARQMMLGVLSIALTVDVFMIFVDVNTWVMLIFGVLLMASVILAWQGHLAPGRVLVPSAALAMFGFLMFQNFGLRDTAVLGLPIAVLLASLLIGRRGAALYGLLSVGLVIALGVAESHGIIHNPMSDHNNLADYIMVSVSLILITALQWLIIGRLNNNLRRARRNEDAQRLANEALRLSEARQRALLSAIPELVFRIRRDGVFLDYHAPDIDRLAAPPETFIGKSVQMVMPPQVADQTQRAIEQVLTTGHPAELEYSLTTGQRLRHFDARMVSSGADEVLTTVRDITERRQVEDSLRESRQMLRNVLEQFPGVVFWKDRQSIYLGCNRAFSTAAGLADPAEIVGKTDFDLPWAATEAVAYRADDSAVMSSRQPRLSITEPRHQSDGRLAWFDTAKVPLFDEQDNVIGVLGTSRDSTEQVHTLHTLRETEFFLNKSQQVARIGSYKFDVASGSWKSSPSLDDILGIDNAFSKTTEGWLSLVAPDDCAMMQDHLLRHVLTDHQRFEQEYRIVRPRDGQLCWVFGLGELEFDDDGHPIRMIGTIQDITERKHAEEALRESEEKYRRLIEVSPVAMWTSKNGIVTYMNPAALRILRATDLQQVVGRAALDFIHPDFHATVKEHVAQLVDREHEEKYIRLDGSVVDVEVTATPFSVRNGSAIQVLFQDITERKRAEAQIEQALRETRVRFEVSQALTGKETEDEVLDVLIQLAGLYPRAFVVIFTFDRQNGEQVGMVRRQNPYQSGLTAALPIGGRLPASRYTLFGRFATQLIVSEDVRVDERFEPAGRDILGQTGATSYAAIPLAVGNEWLGYIAVMAKPIGYFDEEKQHLYQTLADQGAVALRAARLRETIRASQQRLSLLVQQSPLAVIEWNPDWQVVAWNPAAERIFGYTREEALNRHAASFIVPEDARRLLDQDRPAVLAQKDSVYSTYDQLTGDGRRITCEWFSASLVGVNGEVVGIVTLVQDITDRRRVEAEREKLIAELESRNAELERFVYTVSHDLKSPLITIQGFLGFLMKDAIAGNTERLATDIKRIKAAADKMQQLLNDLLELSRIGRMMNPPVEMSFEDVVHEALDLLQGRLADQPVKVTIATPLPIVYGDRARLVEVMQNLIDNAVKFAYDQPDPKIEIGVRETGSASQPIFFVRDNGIGIEPQYHTRVFGLFNKLNAQTEGTGVGLALVKRIVEVHGGRIWVESAGHGSGSTFCFTLAARAEKIDRAP